MRRFLGYLLLVAGLGFAVLAGGCTFVTFLDFAGKPDLEVVLYGALFAAVPAVLGLGVARVGRALLRA